MFSPAKWAHHMPASRGMRINHVECYTGRLINADRSWSRSLGPQWPGWGPTRLRPLLDGVGLILASLLLMRRECLPAEGQAPVEVAATVDSAPPDGLGELKRVQVDGDDVWTHHHGLVLCDASQEGLQPAMEALTCRAGGGGQGPAQSRAHGPRASVKTRGTSESGAPSLVRDREQASGSAIERSPQTLPQLPPVPQKVEVALEGGWRMQVSGE